MPRVLAYAVAVTLMFMSMVTEARSRWSGEAELGFVTTSGNTETETFNGKAKVINERDDWRHTGKLDVLTASNDGTETAERYFVSEKSDYKISEVSYLFGLLTYEDDRFTGYEYRASESLGYGRTVINRETLTLGLEGGAGARQSELAATGQDTSEAVVRVAGELGWVISEEAKFTQDLESEIGEDATITRSATALTTTVAGSLAAKFAVRVKHTSDVPPGIDKTDTETSTTLVYKF